MAPFTWCLPFLCQFIRPPQFSVPVFGERLQYAQNCHEVHNPSLSCTVCCCFSNTVEEEPSTAVAPGASSSNAAAQSWDRHGRERFRVCAHMHSRTEAGSLSYEQHRRSVASCCLLFYPACLCLFPGLSGKTVTKAQSARCAMLKKTHVAHLTEILLSDKIRLQSTATVHHLLNCVRFRDREF